MTTEHETVVVGYVSQVQLGDEGWVSWTMWSVRPNRDEAAARGLATKHVLSLLESKPELLRGRVLRVDHTVVGDAIELVSAAEQADLEADHRRMKRSKT